MKKIIILLFAGISLSACCGMRCGDARHNENMMDAGSCVKPYGCGCTSSYSASCVCSGGEKVTY